LIKICYTETDFLNWADFNSQKQPRLERQNTQKIRAPLLLDQQIVACKPADKV